MYLVLVEKRLVYTEKPNDIDISKIQTKEFRIVVKKMTEKEIQAAKGNLSIDELFFTINHILI